MRYVVRRGARVLLFGVQKCVEVTSANANGSANANAAKLAGFDQALDSSHTQAKQPTGLPYGVRLRWGWRSRVHMPQSTHASAELLRENACHL